MTSQAYSVRVSPRAKHARLKLSARDGLVVVVPRGFDEERIPDLVRAKREWIERSSQRLEQQRQFLDNRRQAALPQRLVLRAIGEEWSVDYRATDAARVISAERPGNRLLVFGNVSDEHAARAALQRWVARKTRLHLKPWLLSLGREKRLSPTRVHVKSQRTRWASCSAKRTISLNLRLMFLPPHLVRYTLLHELAHIQEMNHSRRFWAQVADIAPDYEAADQELRDAWRLIPAWVDDPDEREAA